MKKILSNVLASVMIMFPLCFVCITCGGAQHEPTPEAPDISDCKAACNHIGPKEVYYSNGNVEYFPDALECKEGEPIDMEIPGGLGCTEGIDEVFCVSCEKFCTDTMKHRVWLQPSCVKNITSCEDLETCAPNGAVD